MECGFGFLSVWCGIMVAAGLAVSDGSFGWIGALRHSDLIDPKEQMVRIIMSRSRWFQAQRDFEGAVRQALVE